MLAKNPTDINSGSPDITSPVTDSSILKSVLAQKIRNFMGLKAEIYLPCIPSMLNEYLKLTEDILRLFGQDCNTEQQESLQKLLANSLEKGFNISPHTRLILSYIPADSQKGLASGITFSANVQIESVADKYNTWPQIRPEPLFGSHPDAKVIEIAASLGEPATVPILDVGAGTGRNSLPLAKLGHSVDAIELTPIFAEKLSAAATVENLPIKVTNGDILDPLLRMKAYRYKLIICCEVLSHFREPEQIRLFLGKMCDAVISGGKLLFSVFLTAEGYEPDAMARQMSELSWSFFITSEELRESIEGLPLEIISIEPVIEYEQKRLPAGAWPPTPWFEHWASGRDLFPIQQQPPVELYWILLQRL
jgi:2-polyprenyl-3-methyl-5-hydroxy-6-metoxy-1,4-benzoquinol methylase